MPEQFVIHQYPILKYTNQRDFQLWQSEEFGEISPQHAGTKLHKTFKNIPL